MEELLHVVATDQSSGATAEVFVYSYDTMLSLRRALSTAMKLPQLSLKFDGANTAMHLTLEAAGLQNHSQVQVAPVTEVVLASASSDGTVLMWDAISGKCLESLRGHQGDKVLCVAFAVSGKLMGTSGADGSAKIWETVTGACLCTLKGSDWVTCLAFDPTERTVATAGLDCAARIWDIGSGRCLQVFDGGVSPIFWVCFNPEPDFPELASASADCTATIWKVTGEAQQVLEGHKDNVSMVAFAPSGLRLLTASQDRTARMWEAGTGSCIREFRGHTDTVQCAGFSGDGRLVITASLDRTAKIWEATGDCLRTLSAHAGSVLFAAFAADASFAATGARDGAVRIWDTKTGKLLRIMESHRAKVNALAFVGF
ncbi:unnamed protein product [Effrenium voratum]|uniref:Uncharacterized protein n=1 Tax=Effrenium voratum TaxID=2562239 RepID=A0AA36NAZ5_9DINO|nr:unnamed protein product [Effrenium voratum]